MKRSDFWIKGCYKSKLNKLLEKTYACKVCEAYSDHSWSVKVLWNRDCCHNWRTPQRKGFGFQKFGFKVYKCIHCHKCSPIRSPGSQRRVIFQNFNLTQDVKEKNLMPVTFVANNVWTVKKSKKMVKIPQGTYPKPFHYQDNHQK